MIRRCMIRSAVATMLAVVGCSSDDAPQSQPAPKPPADTTTIFVDPEAAAVSVPATVAPQGKYLELGGAVEFLLVSKGGKAYETIFVTDRSPQEIQDALLKVGLHPGRPAESGADPVGQPVRIDVEIDRDGVKQTLPADRLVVYVATDKDGKKLPGRPLDAMAWPFTGSGLAHDPETKAPILRAMLTGTIVALHPVEASPLFQNPRPQAKQSNIYHANVPDLPPAGTAVRVIFRRAIEPTPAGSRRVYLLAGGRVQGVGFRAFATMQARKLKLTGFVRNLPDGRLEALAEGPTDAVAAWLKKMNRGPRAARVEEFEPADEQPAGDFGSFDIWY